MELIGRYTSPITMSRILIIFMIALLPLRSWAGDLMAVSMSTEALTAATASIAVHQVSADAKDCAGHTGPQSLTSDAIALDDGHCETCVACQICHSVAFVNVISVPHGALEGTVEETLLSSRFASATLADCVKPPIF